MYRLSSNVHMCIPILFYLIIIREKKTRAYKAKDKESLFLLLTEKKQTTNIRQGYPILYVPLSAIDSLFLHLVPQKVSAIHNRQVSTVDRFHQYENDLKIFGSGQNCPH